MAEKTYDMTQSGLNVVYEMFANDGLAIGWVLEHPAGKERLVRLTPKPGAWERPSSGGEWVEVPRREKGNA